MKHTHLDLPMNEIVDNINGFSKKVLSSWYSREQTKSIVEATLVGLKNAVERQNNGRR